MRLRHLQRQTEVGEIKSFFFEPLELINWQAGQYLNLTMPDVPPVDADRLFTIASAPHEKVIQITTIIGPSNFKQRLNLLQPGDEIEADQLGGDFIWQPGKKLFIAGGIGITPYISMIRDQLHKKQPIEATLLYAGKDERRPFVDELKLAALTDPTLKIHHFNHQRLTSEWLESSSLFENFHGVVYIAGSQKFSEDIGEGLITDGLPRQQVKYDYFTGYSSLEY